MTRGTTPTLIFDFCDCIDVSVAERIIVTFSQDGKLLFNKEVNIESDVSDNKINLSLTQDETLSMKAGSYVKCQARLLIRGEAYATPIYKLVVLDCLDDTPLSSGSGIGNVEGAEELLEKKPVLVNADMSCKCNEICVTVGDVMRVKGLDGEDGFSPFIEVFENTDTSYVLKITDKNGSFNTPNLKASASKGIYRFSESSVSSSFSGTPELYKEDLIGKEEPTVGALAIFPDNKSLVLYIGVITAVNGESYTVSQIEYLKDSWQVSGNWISGVIANYPEVYKYQGNSWLCLGKDITTAPQEGKNWYAFVDKEQLGVGGGEYKAGDNIKIENNVISVLTASVAEKDNTKPITSAGVNTIVGNIDILLKTI